MDNKYEEIVKYYDTCEDDYRKLWNLNESLALHAGFWDETVHNLSGALMRENEVLANMCNITQNDRVLDAGCGIGGSSIFLGEKIGCNVTGISISAKQVETATKLADERGLSELVNFQVMDYCNTSFPDESFDVVWAIESVCHAHDKKLFIKEAYRILKPGGRLIVADGFTTATNNISSQSMKKWLSGWAVDSLASDTLFNEYLIDYGFHHIEINDMTKLVMPSSKRLFYISLPTWILSKLGEFIRLRTSIQTGNIRGAFYQYITLKNNLWNYLVFISKK